MPNNILLEQGIKKRKIKDKKTNKYIEKKDFLSQRDLLLYNIKKAWQRKENTIKNTTLKSKRMVSVNKSNYSKLEALSKESKLTENKIVNELIEKEFDRIFADK